MCESKDGEGVDRTAGHSWEAVVLRQVDAFGEGLTEFEEEFIESIRLRLRRGDILTERQEAILARINEERCP